MSRINRNEQVISVRWAFHEQRVVISLHAYFEMQIDEIDTRELFRAGGQCDVLEEYAERHEGLTKLLLGFLGPDDPVHIVANVELFESDAAEPLVIVTVYRPETPRWQDERTRRS